MFIWLDLSSNSLTSIQSGTFSNTKKISALPLFLFDVFIHHSWGNQLQLNHISWLIDLLKSQVIEISWSSQSCVSQGVSLFWNNTSLETNWHNFPHQYSTLTTISMNFTFLFFCVLFEIIFFFFYLGSNSLKSLEQGIFSHLRNLVSLFFQIRFHFFFNLSKEDLMTIVSRLFHRDCLTTTTTSIFFISLLTFTLLLFVWLITWFQTH